MGKGPPERSDFLYLHLIAEVHDSTAERNIQIFEGIPKKVSQYLPLKAEIRAGEGSGGRFSGAGRAENETQSGSIVLGQKIKFEKEASCKTHRLSLP